jgi:uncharacterized protein (TIGR00369 family)
MGLLDNRLCFVCGQENSGGLQARFRIDPEAGWAECRLSIPATFQGWQGVVHGGIVSAVLDEVAIQACRGTAQDLLTAELQIRFRKPVPVGVEVTVRGTIKERRGRIFVVDSELEIAGVSHAAATVKVVRPRPGPDQV